MGGQARQPSVPKRIVVVLKAVAILRDGRAGPPAVGAEADSRCTQGCGHTKGWAGRPASRQCRSGCETRSSQRHLPDLRCGLSEVLERVHGPPVGAAAVAEQLPFGRQRLIGQVIAVEGEDQLLVRGQQAGAQLQSAAAAQRLVLQGVVDPQPEACAVPEVLTDDLRLVAAEEDGVADALAGQPPY